MTKIKIGDFATNVYSQFGEDGIIEKLFSVLGTRTRLCVEFGAWDGVHLSNTRNLWANGWRAVLIEGDPEKYVQLVENTKGYDCLALHGIVGVDHDRDSLEYLLTTNGITDPIDLLSIDVDGNDYYIFESLVRVRPRVLICEYNPTIPYYLDIYADYNNYFGCSVAALNRVANTKGYVLVACTEVNCVYVRTEESSLLDAYETSLDRIVNRKGLNYVITSYAGDYALVGPAWYGLRGPLDINLNTAPDVPINRAVKITKEG